MGFDEMMGVGTGVTADDRDGLVINPTAKSPQANRLARGYKIQRISTHTKAENIINN